MESRNIILEEQIPDEIWLKIFSFLDAKSLVHAQLVCVLFNRLGQDESLWEALCRKQAPVKSTNMKDGSDTTNVSLESFYITSYRDFFAQHLPKDHLYAVVGPVDNLNRSTLLATLKKQMKENMQVCFYITKKEAEDHCWSDHHVIKIEHNGLPLKKWHYGNFYRHFYIATITDEFINKFVDKVFPKPPSQRCIVS